MLTTYTKRDNQFGYEFDYPESLPEGSRQVGVGKPGAGYDPLAMAADMLEWSDLVVLKGTPEDGCIEAYKVPKK